MLLGAQGKQGHAVTLKHLEVTGVLLSVRFAAISKRLNRYTEV